MSKMWHKKSEILKLLERKPMTVSDISKKLGLAVSTASQHMSELRSVGAIEELEIGHTKKWRYYRTNPSFQLDKVVGNGANGTGGFGKVAEVVREGMGSKPVIIGTVVAALAILATLLYVNPRSFDRGNDILFSITDPPTVPYGTQALVMNFSSIEVRATRGTQTSWIKVNGGGTINLLDIVNASKVVGLIKVQDNYTVDELRFNINSVKIEINGATYNVSLPETQAVAEILPSAIVNSSSEVLIDLYPTVNPVYATTNTSFSLLLSIKAVALDRQAQPPQGIVAKTGPWERPYFANLPSEISLYNASIEQYDNTTKISLEVTNTANRSLLIRHVLVLGPLSVTAGGGGIQPGPWPFNAGVGSKAVMANEGPPASPAGGLQMIGFIVESNGTMELQKSLMQEFNTGYIIAQGSSKTLSYDGNMSFGNRIRVGLVPGARYRLVVVGQNIYAHNETG